jgi:GH15 family glucan-1,4-alpha-glucosidase
VDRWRAIRDQIHREVMEKAWDDKRKTFTQSYGSRALDASVLLIPLVGFLPPSHPRVAQTAECLQRELASDGFILRYSQDAQGEVDGLKGTEGAFLACSFWLADNLFLIGKKEEGERLFTRLIGLCNDVGLLAEEYDPIAKRMVGNFPQAFSHVALINSARNLSGSHGPARERHGEEDPEA